MFYDYSPESAADIINTLDGPHTVILGHTAGDSWTSLLALLPTFVPAPNHGQFLTDGNLGTVGEVRVLFSCLNNQKLTGDNEFAVLEGNFPSLEDAVNSGQIAKMPALRIEHVPQLVTVDDMEHLAASATEILVHSEIIKGRVIYLTVSKEEVMGLFFGRNGEASVRAYLNERHQLLLCTPVPELEEPPEAP